jgi:hypothetical protein
MYESNRRRASGIHIPLISTAADAPAGALTDAMELAAMIIVVAVGPGSWEIVVAPERGDRHTFRVSVDPLSPDS